MGPSTKRQTLKKLGVGIPVAWMTPVVSSVVLPVHAQTTPPVAPPQIFAIGDTGPGGGIVFQISNGGLNGLEAARADQSTGAQWGCSGVDVTGATGTAIGTGASNTAAILAASCPGSSPDAANAAANFNGGGFNDWFLPSEDELNAMFIELHLNGLGGFGGGIYWSSSQSSAILARFQLFTGGTRGDNGKTVTLRVRAARAF